MIEKLKTYQQILKKLKDINPSDREGTRRKSGVLFLRMHLQIRISQYSKLRVYRPARICFAERDMTS